MSTFANSPSALVAAEATFPVRIDRNDRTRFLLAYAAAFGLFVPSQWTLHSLALLSPVRVQYMCCARVLLSYTFISRETLERPEDRVQQLHSANAVQCRCVLCVAAAPVAVPITTPSLYEQLAREREDARCYCVSEPESELQPAPEAERKTSSCRRSHVSNRTGTKCNEAAPLNIALSQERPNYRRIFLNHILFVLSNGMVVVCSIISLNQIISRRSVPPGNSGGGVER